MGKFKKILNLGPGFANVVITGNSVEEVNTKYKKELEKILPLIGGNADNIVKTEIIEESKEVIRVNNSEVKKRVLKRVVEETIEEKPKVPIMIKDTSKILQSVSWPDNGKPRIVLVTDVRGWAWWIKSMYLIKHLSDDFNFITVPAQEQTTNWKKLEGDLYLTYGWDYFHRLSNVDKKRIVSGITAHKDKSTWQNGVLRTLKQCEWVHANSIMLKNALQEGGIKDVYYVPNGVDENLFVEKKPINILTSKKFVAGHVGKVAGIGGKGQKEFLEPAAAQAEVEWKGHYNNYTNRVEHDKMVDFYQDIDAFFVASITDGTPNGALEASACGRPVVSNRIGNMPEFIVNGVNGFIVERKVNDYVEKMKLLANDRELCYEMGQNARKTIEESWTWIAMAENYRNMFWDILKKIG
jgi:glycosyltransferase involved in cell wall biosynthesis